MTIVAEAKRFELLDRRSDQHLSRVPLSAAQARLQCADSSQAATHNSIIPYHRHCARTTRASVTTIMASHLPSYDGGMSTAPRLAAVKRDWGHDQTGCTVLHIDMDAFFASCELARHPEFTGRPLIVGTGARAVVSAASYEARRYGVNSAMPLTRARRLCPQGVFLPVDMAYYRSISRSIFTDIIGAVTDRVEQVSVDEGFVDVTPALRRWGAPSRIGTWIRRQVRRRHSITCSVGIAANKLIAKLASTNAKPDGMLLIPRGRQAEFIQMMPLRAVPGIGPALERRLNAWGVVTMADLVRLDERELIRATGSAVTAHTLHQAARGIDERPVIPYTPEKSVGSESTFPEDTTDMARVLALLRRCCDTVASALRTRGRMARTVTVKLRFADLSYATRSHTLGHPVDTAAAMYPETVRLLGAMLDIPDVAKRARRAETAADALPRMIRLAGVNASGLELTGTTVMQPSLNEILEEEDSPTGCTRSERQRLAERALDTIRRRYGRSAAKLGA